MDGFLHKGFPAAGPPRGPVSRLIRSAGLSRPANVGEIRNAESFGPNTCFVRGKQVFCPDRNNRATPRTPGRSFLRCFLSLCLSLGKITFFHQYILEGTFERAFHDRNPGPGISIERDNRPVQV